MEILQFEFFRNALIAAVLASIACGIIGVFVVVRRLVSISGGIAHSAFGGVGLGYLLGIDPLIAVIPFTILAASGIGILKIKTKLTEDTAIGIFWSIGMALGIVFIGFSSGYMPDLMGYLFGNILAVSQSDLLLMVILDISIMLIVSMFYRQLEASAFDEEFAQVRNLNSVFLYFMLLILIAVSVVVLIRVVGIILVIALLTIPAALARQYSVDMKKTMILAVMLSIVLTTAGLLISYIFNVSSGAAIVLISGTVLGISSLVKNTRRKKGI